MNASTQTPAPAATNPGMLAMRRTLKGMAMCRKLGLEPRTAPASKPATRTQPARKSVAAPAPKQADDAPESLRDWRVGVLVKRGEAQECVWVAVSAPGAKRAGNAARAEARLAGHETVGVCATLRDDAPAAMLALAV